MAICHVCGTSQGQDFMWETSIVRCPTCGLCYWEPQPTFEEIEAIYNDGKYFSGDSYVNYVGEKEMIQANFKDRLRILHRHRAAGGELLEIGSAYGFFLDLARSQYDSVKGIELSSEAGEYAREHLGLDIVVGDLESHPPEHSAYDVVTMWDTIEHLYDPRAALQACANALREGGLLALTTGDIDARLPQFQKAGWRLIMPQHLFYFSEKSLRYLLTAVGLEVIHVSHPGYRRTLRQMMRVLDWKESGTSWRSKLVGGLQRLPGMNLHISINLYDIIYVIARKPGSKG